MRELAAEGGALNVTVKTLGDRCR